MAAQAIKVIIQMGSLVVLARVLTPEDYGVISMVLVVTSFAGLFRDLGLSSAAIQKKDLTTEQQSNLFWLNVSMGLVLMLLVSACAPLVAKFYGQAELRGLTIFLSSTFLISSVSAQHGAMLVRRMQFGRSSFAAVAGAIVTMAVSISLALHEYAYWALALGTVAGALVTSGLTIVLSSFRPGLPCRGSGVRELVGFGANVTMANFINYFSRNLDKLLIGKIAGAEALGIYGRAYQLLMFPIVNIRAPIQAVAFPAMSKLDSGSEDYRQYYIKLVRLLAWGTMPLMAFVLVAAREIVLLVLGDSWEAVIPIIMILALAGMIQPVSSLRGLVLMSSGQTFRQVKAGLMTAMVVSLSFCIGAFWGVLGVAWSYVVAIWLLMLPMQKYACSRTSINLISFVGACVVPLLASLLAIVGASLVAGCMTQDSIFLMFFLKLLVVMLVCGALVLADSTSRKLVFSVLATMKHG